MKRFREFKFIRVKDTLTDKILNFSIDDKSDKVTGQTMSQYSNPLDLMKVDWYVFNDNFGSSEEKELILYIKSIYDNLKEKYEIIYLKRNERHFKIYNFEDGQATEPDFVLFLNNKDGANNVIYQIFIEPKGKHITAGEDWKQGFLMSIKEKRRVIMLHENEKVTLW